MATVHPVERRSKMTIESPTSDVCRCLDVAMTGGASPQVAGVSPPLCKRPLQALKALTRFCGRRSAPQRQRLVEVSDRMVAVVHAFVGFAAGGIGVSIFRSEPNCFGGVRDRAVVIALAVISFAAASVG